jgi:thioredoxin 1
MLKEFNKELLEEKGLVFLDFYADWCNPCKQYKPVFERIANAYEETFAKVDVEQFSDIAAKFKIKTVPTTLVLRDGVEVVRKAGAISESVLNDWIVELRSK